MSKQKFDFAGYATKVGIRCSDGRTISKDAFIGNDNKSVPLVWQHMHSDPANVLGYANLENRPDGVYAYCFFNESDSAKQARELVRHRDINSLSIYANSLVEKGKVVLHGVIREVSLVLAGANDGAKIENIAFEHSDGKVTEDASEAIIMHMADLIIGEDSDEKDDELKHKSEDTKTLADVFNTLNDDQKTMLFAMLGEASAGTETKEEVKHSDKGEKEDMKKNIFDKSLNKDEKNTLTHDQLKVIFENAQRCGSLKEAFLQHGPNGVPGVDYGITDIDFLFPDHRSVTPEPKMIQRDTEWVKDVFGAAHKVPFSRIKSLAADITADEARARGYITGNRKVEEVIPLLKRTTGPTTVYKKQKLDRDDIVDIVDLDVVAWLKREMRGLLNEELARAVLTGDGRSPASDDKIREDCIRPIYTDDGLFSVRLKLDEDTTTMQLIDQIILSRKLYKGAGNPTFFSTPDIIGDMLLLKDTTGRRLYNTLTDLTAALRVSKIVEVPIMENITREESGTNNEYALLAIMVNMRDYYIGADKGGAINLFDDFDIDYNQYKYLIETRCSGALVTPHSAIIVEKRTSSEPNPE